MGSLLFQPLQGQLRGAAQTISEGIMQPLAIGVAGVILLVFKYDPGPGCGGPCIRVPGCGRSVVLVHFCADSQLSSGDERCAQEADALGESTTVIFDPSAVDLLRRALHQPQPGQALYALTTNCEQIASESWPDVLARSCRSYFSTHRQTSAWRRPTRRSGCYRPIAPSCSETGSEEAGSRVSGPCCCDFWSHAGSRRVEYCCRP